RWMRTHGCTSRLAPSRGPTRWRAPASTRRGNAPTSARSSHSATPPPLMPSTRSRAGHQAHVAATHQAHVAATQPNRPSLLRATPAPSVGITTPAPQMHRPPCLCQDGRALPRALSQRSLMRRHFAMLALATTVAVAMTACTSATDPAPSPTADVVTSQPEPAATSAPAPVDPNDPTGGFTALFDPGSNADAEVLLLRNKGKTEEAELIQRIADQPIAVWLGNWTTDPTTTVGSISERALKAEQIAIFVVY